MDPVNPWLDPAEVRRMAERLLKPQDEASVNLPDAGFGERFVGFAADKPARTVPAVPPPAPPASPPPPRAAEPTAAAPSAPPPPPVATESSAAPRGAGPAEPPPAPAADEPPAASPRSPFLDRITRFRDWLHEQFSATGVFILDREGAVIFDESGHGKLHFLARSLALASRRPGGSPGNVHVKVGASATLEVIPVDSPYGCLVLGAVVPQPLPPAAVSGVMVALAKVASPPPNGPAA